MAENQTGQAVSGAFNRVEAFRRLYERSDQAIAQDASRRELLEHARQLSAEPPAVGGLAAPEPDPRAEDSEEIRRLSGAGPGNDTSASEEGFQGCHAGLPNREVLRLVAARDHETPLLSNYDGAALVGVRQLQTPESELESELSLGHAAWVDAHLELWHLDGFVEGQLAARLTVQLWPDGSRAPVLHDITVRGERQGRSERIVAALLASLNDELKILDVPRPAEPFWYKMGATLLDPYKNIRIDWYDYHRARNRRPGLPERETLPYAGAEELVDEGAAGAPEPPGGAGGFGGEFALDDLDSGVEGVPAEWFSDGQDS